MIVVWCLLSVVLLSQLSRSVRARSSLGESCLLTCFVSPRGMCRGSGHFPLTPAGRPLSGRGLLAASGALAPDPCLHPSAPARTPHLSLSVTSPLRLGCRVRRPTHPRAQSRGQSSADPRGGPARGGRPALVSAWSRCGHSCKCG